MPAKKPKTRPQTKKRTTKENLVDTAELLFARKGVRQVALREIAKKAGMTYKFAVQYHFGNRDELIRGVFERRLPQLEARRAELLAAVKARGALNDTGALYEVMIRPVAEIVQGGLHSYAAFMLALYEIERDWASRMNVDELSPFSKYVLDLIRQSVPHLNAKQFVARSHAATLVFLDLVARIDEKKLHLSIDQLVQEAVTLTVAILKAPTTALETLR